jgi:transposase
MSQPPSRPPITQQQLERLPAEAREIVRAIIAHYENRIAELEDKLAKLEARVPKTPQNSSLPPSSQHPHGKPKPPRKPSNRKRGGQKGHPKHERTLVPPEEIDETIVLRPDACRRCGKALSGDDPHPLRHQVFELPEIKPIITEYQQHRLQCPCCSTATTAALPAGVPAGQSGPRLVAFTGLLMAYFRQSKRRTAEFLQTLLNTPCSVGLTVKHQNIVADALHHNYNELRNTLPNCAGVGMDETAMKEANKKVYLWTAVTKDFTLFAIRDSRKADVAKELLGENFTGVVTSDRYAGYDWIGLRQLCWEHIKRDFQWLIDHGGQTKVIGERLLSSAWKLFHHWHRARDGTIRPATLRRNIRRLWWPVYEALEDGSLNLTGKAAGMCAHMFARFDSLWTFLDHTGVEPTNNASERALRHAVIWRKLSFGTQSESGSRFMERTLSVIETCRQQGRSTLRFITEAVTAHFHGEPGPHLLSGV